MAGEGICEVEVALLKIPTCCNCGKCTEHSNLSKSRNRGKDINHINNSI
jgi:hypothetical protein